MFNYYFDRGLSVVEELAKLFRDRTWYLPDLICDDVLDKIKEHVKEIEYYAINDDFGWSFTPTQNEYNVFYLINYFGKETRIKTETNTVVINDSVWFPHPFHPVENNHIWFNSLRKIFRGAKGSSVVSSYRLGNDEVKGIFNHPSLTWKEVDTRFKNFNTCKKLFRDYGVRYFNPEFPTVFPLILDDRDEILEKSGLTDKLPGMWKNKHHLYNPLYKKLAFIPVDSRFNEEKLTELYLKIKECI